MNDFDTFQKLPNNVGDLAKIIDVASFECLPKKQKTAQSGHNGHLPQGMDARYAMKQIRFFQCLFSMFSSVHVSLSSSSLSSTTDISIFSVIHLNRNKINFKSNRPTFLFISSWAREFTQFFVGGCTCTYHCTYCLTGLDLVALLTLKFTTYLLVWLNQNQLNALQWHGTLDWEEMKARIRTIGNLFVPNNRDSSWRRMPNFFLIFLLLKSSIIMASIGSGHKHLEINRSLTQPAGLCLLY